MTFRIAPWLVLLGASMPLSASPVTSCGVQPSGQTCTLVTTTLTPFPTITAEASATDAIAMAGGGFFGGPVQGLTFDFEVVGPPTTAVQVGILLGGVFENGTLPDGGWSPCAEQGFGIAAFAYQCSGAQIVSPGWYFGMNFPVPPLMTGVILPNPTPWIVPNEWNEATIGAGAGVFARNPGVSTSLESISTTSMQLLVAAPYQIVIAPEPGSGVLLAIGLVALFAMTHRRKRAHVGDLEH